MSTHSMPLKRVKRKFKKCQNPLFEKWLKEWKEEASKNGSEMQYCFSRALKSLQKFPFKLSNGKECIILENFGSKICNMLDKKLEEHIAAHQKVDEVNQECRIRNNTNQTNGKKRKSTEIIENNKKVAASDSDSGIVVNEPEDYYPKYRSGGYAILIAMFEKSQEENFKGFLTKSEIEESAQEYCSSSFTVPRSGSSYTAWSSMSLLIKKNLVKKKGNPARFSLTETGTDMAIKLKFRNNSVKNSHSQEFNSVPRDETQIHPKIFKPSREKHSALENSEEIEQNTANCISHSSERIQPKPKLVTQLECKEKDTEFHKSDNETIFMVPNSFSIILLVDNQERDNKFQQADQMTMRELKSRHVNFEIRHLKVGDFTWIARNSKGQELVLPYVVERKRMDDLASSIKDGRFHEQKFRLKQSGLENLIYLVEKYGSESQRLGLPLPTLMQAISNTQIVGGFNVKITNNHNHSMRYLDCMTTQLNTIFQNKTLMSCQKSNLTRLNLSDDFACLMTFDDFNKGSEKNKKPTVRNMLVKHLLQLNGLSVEKAKAIVQLYPTPKALMRALKEPDGEKSIGKLTYGACNRSIGPVTAKQIHMLYTSAVLK